MILVKNVKNNMTGEVGELGLVGYKYTDEVSIERKSTHRGLVVFFNNKYVKSFILTKNEVELITKHNANIVEDLGYILSLGGNTLRMYDLAAYHSVYEKCDGGCGLSTIGVYEFVLDYNIAHVDSYISIHNAWGFQLALISALENLKETDYLVSRELHTPTQIFDFTKIRLD